MSVACVRGSAVPDNRPVSDLFTDPNFNKRMLERIAGISSVVIDDRRLRVTLERSTDGGIPETWLRTLRCTVFDPKNMVLTEAAIESCADGREDQATGRGSFLISETMRSDVGHVGDLARRTAVTFRTPDGSKKTFVVDQRVAP